MTKALPAITFEDDSLGEAMCALSPLMRAWVHYKVQLGCSDKEAARLAGYSAVSDHALESTAHRVAHDDRVQRAIKEEADKLMRTHGPKSVLTLVELRDKSKDPKVRLKASTELLDRSGFHRVSESTLHVEHKLSEAQMDARILALAAELQIPREIAERMLIDTSRVIEAEFEVVQPAAEPLSTQEEAEQDGEDDPFTWKPEEER